MQAKKTNPEKTKNPEMLTLDSTYRIGNRSFIVEPVFKEESSQTLGEVLLRLMKSESENYNDLSGGSGQRKRIVL